MQPIFVGGCGRSGTTLLAALLAGNRAVMAPPEAQFLLQGLAVSHRNGGDDPMAFATVVRDDWRYHIWGLPRELPVQLARRCSRSAEVMAGLAQAYAEQGGREGVERWVDHTPINIGYAPTLFSEFEGAPMVHIVRDPRAVVASVLPLDWGPSSVRAAARWWLSMIGMGLAAEASYPGRVVRVHFESLVTNPRVSLERLCHILGLEFEPGMLEGGRAEVPGYTRKQHALVGKPPDLARIDAWRSQLSAREIKTLEGELRDVATMLGYEPASEGPVIMVEGSAREFLVTALRSAQQRWQWHARRRRAAAQNGQPGGAGSVAVPKA